MKKALILAVVASLLFVTSAFADHYPRRYVTVNVAVRPIYYQPACPIYYQPVYIPRPIVILPYRHFTPCRPVRPVFRDSHWQHRVDRHDRNSHNRHDRGRHGNNRGSRR